MKPNTQPDPFRILESDSLPDNDDDVLLPRTPDDVVAVLGFDPLEFETQPPAKQRKAKR
jgi:hypothetical protein